MSTAYVCLVECSGFFAPAIADLWRLLVALIEDDKGMDKKSGKFATGADVFDFRRRLGVKQADFWRRVGVTQSGGSRYEAGREIPSQVVTLLQLVYLPHDEACEVFAGLRSASERRPRYKLSKLLDGITELPVDSEWDAMPAVGAERLDD